MKDGILEIGFSYTSQKNGLICMMNKVFLNSMPILGFILAKLQYIIFQHWLYCTLENLKVCQQHDIKNILAFKAIFFFAGNLKTRSLVPDPSLLRCYWWWRYDVAFAMRAKCAGQHANEQRETIDAGNTRDIQLRYSSFLNDIGLSLNKCRLVHTIRTVLFDLW